MPITGVEEPVRSTGDRNAITEISFHVEQFTDLQELDSDWDDEEVEEIIVITPKTPNRFSPLSIIVEDALDCSQSFGLSERCGTPDFQEMIPTLSSLDDFDFPYCADAQKCTCSSCFVYHRDSRQLYAIKRFLPRDMMDELSILEMLSDHGTPFVPQIHWQVFDEEGIVLVTDYHLGGSLLYYVLQEGPLDSGDLLFYASEIAEALFVLHSIGVQHRDLSPGNVMIGAGGHIVLTGFEYARSSLQKHSSIIPIKDDASLRSIPTREHEYRAPEILLGWTEDEAVDSWSFGCLLYFLAAGKHPFIFEHQELRNRVLRKNDFDGERWSDLESNYILRNLISKCMECNPKLRLDIQGIKDHPYFNSIDWTQVQQMNLPAPYTPSSYSISTNKSTLCIPPKSSETRATTPTSTPPLFSKNIETILQDTAPSESDHRLSTETSNLDQDLNQDHKTSSIYSLQARHSVQDLLPKIFRSPSLDERALEESKTRLSQLEVTGSSPIIRAPSYERLKAQQDLSPGERMAMFWDSIDQDVKTSKPKPKNWFGKPTFLTDAPPSPPLSPNLVSTILETEYSKPRKLRKQSSSIITSQTQRISQLFTRSSVSNLSPSKLPKMKRAKSTPVLSSVDPATEKMTKIVDSSHASVPHADQEGKEPLDLPNGIEQIGSGIGFTLYNISDASKTKASICSGQNAAGIGSGSRLGLGLGLGFGHGPSFVPRKSGLFGGILKSKSKAKQAGSMWQDGGSLNQNAWQKKGSQSRWPSRMTPIRETRESESDAPTRGESISVNVVDVDTECDVFRCGSTLSMLPDASTNHRDTLTDAVICIGNPEISPMTATESTVGNSPFSELGPLEPGTRVLSESLKEIVWGDRATVREGRNSDQSYLDMGRATLRLIGSTSSLVLGRA
ncbi:kinase-like protein [Dendrothele bispora CBS 962.96]|uniref:Kinase-like protein n=1 Tax=Dendrothele bispora (strain CBS 962.96) TaxID=1314807 RepID=A0A4S8KSH2_DENBC|nr:kinase-like protein [Dendrothele bispora CBS 962.96]